MRVCDLMAQLSKFPLDMEVRIPCKGQDGEWLKEITSVQETGCIEIHKKVVSIRCR